MQVHITKISRKEKTSTRTNKPFTSLGIMTREHGEKWLSGFGNKDNAGWNVGDDVEIDVEQKGEYLNFSTPKNTNGTDKPTASTSADIAWIKNTLSMKVIPMLESINSKLEEEGDDYPTGGEPNF